MHACMHEEITNSQLGLVMHIYRLLLLFSICLTSFGVVGEPQLYKFNEGIKAQIKSASDCIPNFNGKVSLGENKYGYNWECRNQSGNTRKLSM